MNKPEANRLASFLALPEVKLFTGAACIGFAPIFVKALDLSSSMIGFYRCLLGFMIFIPFAFSARREFPLADLFTGATTKFWWIMILAGTVFSIDLFVWHKSIVYIGAGLATMLANSQVFVLALFGSVFLNEKINKRFLLSLGLGALGIYLLLKYNHSSESTHPNYTLGVIFAFVTAVVYAAYIVCMRNCERYIAKISTTQKNMIASLFTSIGLLSLGLTFHEASIPTSPKTWILLLGLAVSGQVIAWHLITKNLPKVPVSRAGLLMLAQPIFATIFGAIFFGETLSLAQFVGTALTLFAMYLGNTRTIKN